MLISRSQLIRLRRYYVLLYLQLLKILGKDTIEANTRGSFSEHSYTINFCSPSGDTEWTSSGNEISRIFKSDRSFE